MRDGEKKVLKNLDKIAEFLLTYKGNIPGEIIGMVGFCVGYLNAKFSIEYKEEGENE